MIALSSAGSIAVPVGLFGDAKNTTSGFSRPISAVAASTSMLKSSRRIPSTQRVWVLRAYSGYIE